MDIGIIGLGLVGQAMAQRLLTQEHTLYGFDISEEACRRAQQLGVNILLPGEMPEHCRIFFLSLPTSKERRELLWGEGGMAPRLHTATLILDTTTARPEDIEEDAARLAAQGVRLVDVCISGSSQAVAEGQAVALVGDRAEDGTYYKPLLDLFTKKSFFLGAAGQGNRAKLIVNLVFGLNRLVLAEALSLGERGGFEMKTVLDMLREGDTYSRVMDTKGPRMVTGSFEPPVARLAQHAKDVGLILEYANELGAQVPLTILHSTMIYTLVAAGHGQLDNSAIIKWYEEAPSERRSP